MDVLSQDACELLCNGLPQAKSLDEALAVIEQARSMMLGAGILTVNLDVTSPEDPPGEIRLQRIWTSEPGAYPVGGAKRKTGTPWTCHLLEQCKVFVGEGDRALAEVFDDHALIASLGLQAVVNVPIVRDGRCAATFNVLDAGCRHADARRRALHLVSPSLALRDGGPYMVFGTPGGDQQDQWSTAFFLRHAVHGMNLQEAIDAPAWHINHFPSSFWPRQTTLNTLTVESRFCSRGGRRAAGGRPRREGRRAVVRRPHVGLHPRARQPRTTGVQGRRQPARHARLRSRAITPFSFSKPSRKAA